jgi:hypothetical protein
VEFKELSDVDARGDGEVSFLVTNGFDRPVYVQGRRAYLFFGPIETWFPYVSISCAHSNQPGVLSTIITSAGFADESGKSIRIRSGGQVTIQIPARGLQAYKGENCSLRMFLNDGLVAESSFKP